MTGALREVLKNRWVEVGSCNPRKKGFDVKNEVLCYMTNHCCVYFTIPWGCTRAHLSVHHPCVLAGSIYFIMSFVLPSRHTTCQLDTAESQTLISKQKFFHLFIVSLKRYKCLFHDILFILSVISVYQRYGNWVINLLKVIKLGKNTMMKFYNNMAVLGALYMDKDD